MSDGDGAARFGTRRVGEGDAALVARHRAAMFLEQSMVPPHLGEAVTAASAAYLEGAIADGSYVGWLATAPGGGEVVAGVGMQIRSIVPRAAVSPDGVAEIVDREGIVLNAWTERAWRRRGIARHLMRSLIAWSDAQHLSRIILNASVDGRALYASLGFVAGNEMRLERPLRPG